MNPPWVYLCSTSWNPLPAPSLFHPSGSSQCTSPEHPVSCIEPGLGIHFTYDIIHVSMPSSQIIPPSPSPVCETAKETEIYRMAFWTLWNWCFWTVVLEKTLESPLGCKEIQPIHPKGDQPWVFIGRTYVEAEIPILWPPDGKSWLIWKDPDAGKDWGQEGKGMTEDEMVGWHHRLNGHGFGWTLGIGDGQGGLACCGSWDHKESDMTEWLNWILYLIVRDLPPYNQEKIKFFYHYFYSILYVVLSREIR